VPAPIGKPIEKILLHGSAADLVNQLHYKQMQKDLEYSLESLRRQWVAYPERRLDIEAQAQALRAELHSVEARIPRSLAELERSDPGVPVAVLELMILKTADYLNIGKNITPDQIRETAELLAAEFGHLSLEHFAVVMQRAKLGQWQVYDRLDGQVIATWLRSYVQELQSAAALAAQNRHLASKESRLGSGDTYRIRDLMPKYDER
jgi:hypothetical protein